MKRIDYKVALKPFYQPSVREVTVVEVPAMQFLQISGAGAPGSPAYQAAVEALYTVSYTLKFMIKRELRLMDYGVMPLEGLWWADDMEDYITRRKESWKWNLMIMQPDCVTPELYGEAVDRARRKKPLQTLDSIAFETFAEGRCAQILHKGPFEEEGPTVQRIHEYIANSGHFLSGKHHEIYLTDIRRALPANWRTVIRQPMRRAGE